MSGSESPERRPLLNTILHPAVAICVPLLFLVFITQVLRNTTSLPLTPWVYLFLILAAVEEVVTGNILFQERVGTFERIREPIYVLAAVAAVVLVFQRPIALRSLVQYHLIYLGFIVLMQWLFTWRIHAALRDREIFEGLLDGKAGSDLQLTIRDNAEMARLSVSSIPRVRKAIGIFQFLSFALMVVLFAVGIDVSAGTVGVFFLQGILGLVFLTLLNNATEDQLLAADGVAVTPFYRRRRVIYAVVLMSLGMIVVILFARQTSVLPLSLFKPLIDWLRSLLDRDMEARPLPRIQTNVPSPQRDLIGLLDLEDREPSPWIELLRFIFRVLWNVIKWLALVLAAYFFISPILSKYFRTRLRGLKPLAFLLEQSERLYRYLKTVWDDIVAWLRRPPSERRAKRRSKQKEWTRRLRLSRPGVFKRMEMGRVLRAYVKLIRWGRKRGVPFRTPYAPMEYAGRVSEKMPDAAESLTDAMAILEEALFSPGRIGRERVHRYLRTIREITGRRV